MKHEKLSQALNEVRDEYIAEAAGKKQRRYAPWLGAVAAVLVVAILAGLLWRPGTPQDPVASLEHDPTDPTIVVVPPVVADSIKYQVAGPVYPVMQKRPSEDESFDYEEFKAWRDSVDVIHDQPRDYGDVMQDYFKTVTPAVLEDPNNPNPVCSPVNIYMALAMLAETANGETRQELLDFLGVETIEQLRKLAGYVWNGHYWDDGVSTSILGNSLWLDEFYNYNPECAEALAQYYYASSFSGDLGTAEMDKALQNWLNEQTGGLLEEYAKAVKLDPLTVFVLASTIYYKVGWSSDFNESRNTEQTFYGKDNEITTTFMNTTNEGDTYYWGDNYGAVNLYLEDGSRMWLILPEENTDTNAVLRSDDLWAMLNASYLEYENQKQMKINLSVPKFKVDASMELKDLLGSLGLSITMGENPDFSNLIPDSQLEVTTVTHAATVEIDEEGVAAAAFTVIAPGDNGMPIKEDEIDFVLDRPFIFIIESSDGLPLFAGVVNQL